MDKIRQTDVYAYIYSIPYTTLYIIHTAVQYTCLPLIKSIDNIAPAYITMDISKSMQATQTHTNMFDSLGMERREVSEL